MSVQFISVAILFCIIVWASYSSNRQKMYWGTILQAFETVYLLDTTKKCDVFRSRFAFLRKIAPTLIEGSEKNSYPNWLKTARKEYKKRYHDRYISDHQNQVISNPSQILTTEFKGQQYVSWFRLYCDTKENEITSLKTASAKQRRRDQALETAKILLADMAQKECLPYHLQIADELRRFDINLNLEYL